MGFTLRRQAARVVLFDSTGSVLLIRSADPVDRHKPPWWEIPGGGIEGGESTSDAALRELVEETGIDDARIGPCVWTQHARFTFAGIRFDQHESVHVAWTDRPAGEIRIAPTGLELLEASAFREHRWWVVDDLCADADPLVPPRMREFLPSIARGDLPRSPLDITPHT